MRNARSTRRNARLRTVNYTADDALLEHALIGKRMSLFLFEALNAKEIASARAKLEVVLNALASFSDALPDGMSSAKDAMNNAVNALEKMKGDLRSAAGANDDAKMEILVNQLTETNKLTAALMNALSDSFGEAKAAIERLANARTGSFEGYDPNKPFGEVLDAEEVKSLSDAVKKAFNDNFKGLFSTLKASKSAVKSAKNKSRGVLQKLRNIFNDGDDYLDALENACSESLYLDKFMKVSLNDIDKTSEDFTKIGNSLKAKLSGNVLSLKRSTRPEASASTSPEQKRDASPNPSTASDVAPATRAPGSLAASDSKPAETGPPTSTNASSSRNADQLSAPRDAERPADANAEPSPEVQDNATAESPPKDERSGESPKDKKISNLGVPARGRGAEAKAAEILRDKFGDNYKQVMSALGTNKAYDAHGRLLKALDTYRKLTAAGVVFESKKSPDGLIVERWNVLAGTDKKR